MWEQQREGLRSGRLKDRMTLDLIPHPARHLPPPRHQQLSQEIPSPCHARPGGQRAAQPWPVHLGAQQSPSISHVAAGALPACPSIFPTSKETGSGPGLLMTEECSASKGMSKQPAVKEAKINGFSAWRETPGRMGLPAAILEVAC